MLGAIAGDIIGSLYENLRTKRKDFRLFTPLSFFTDDTVLTVAVADALLTGKDYGSAIKAYARRHPLRGYPANLQNQPDVSRIGSRGDHRFSRLGELRGCHTERRLTWRRR